MATATETSFLPGMNEDQHALINNFHELYYSSRYSNMTWANTRWLGVKTLKCPLDLWLYQEILFERRPDLIIETGTAFGGSALYLANMCDLMGQGQIISIDIESQPDWPQHPRISYVQGSSTAPAIVDSMRRRAEKSREVLVILDSDHRKPHVDEELRAYAPLIKPNGYLIVEDTIVNGHPVRPDFGPGPMEAVEEFLERSPNWMIDRSMEKFLLSFNRNGYLKRIQ